MFFFFFFFNDTATTEIYTLSLHDALPICQLQARRLVHWVEGDVADVVLEQHRDLHRADVDRSEEHTSELQSRLHLVCRLLLEKKKHPRCRVRAERRYPQTLRRLSTSRTLG